MCLFTCETECNVLLNSAFLGGEIFWFWLPYRTLFLNFFSKNYSNKIHTKTVAQLAFSSIYNER